MAGRARVYEVKGLRELLRATDAADKDTKKLVRDELRQVAEPVREEAAARFAAVDQRSASRYRVRVRRVGVVAVEQSLRRTTGKRPDFGRLQMVRALVPALAAREDDVVAGLDNAMERIERKWGSRIV